MFRKLSLVAALLALTPMVMAGAAQAHGRDRVIEKDIILEKNFPRGRIEVFYRGFRDRIYNRWYGAGPLRCVAVAKKRRGYGKRIRSTRSVNFGRGWRACRRAMRSCREKLSYRQARGRNPRATCVVVAAERTHRRYGYHR